MSLLFCCLCAVAVGYMYEICAERLYWEVQSAKIAGNDMMSSEIGGWNVDVHHVYSVQEGNTLTWHTRLSLYSQLQDGCTHA